MKKDGIEKRSTDQNVKIKRLSEELQSRSEELLQQELELIAEREKLEGANIIIEQQQKELIELDLQQGDRKLLENSELDEVNRDLLRKNTNLLQFSYTVSHNLRGPIANILALAELFKLEVDESKKNVVAELIFNSVKQLDSVFTDLSKIINIDDLSKNQLEKIDLYEVWKDVKALLGSEISSEFIFTEDLSTAGIIYGSRAMVHSILYNLASNSIKYRSPDRILNVRITTAIEFNGDIALYFEDNGLGIDLGANRDKLFILHQRFHSHVDGHGVGLYLAKSQMEAMQGTITVDSVVNKGTIFTLYFRRHYQGNTLAHFNSDDR